MKNSSDTIGNRSHDLPVCSAVTQPLRVPFRFISNILKAGCYLQENTPHLGCLNMFRKTVAVENQTRLRDTRMLKQVVQRITVL
jgi:hypothetical protein